jgi:DNA replication protein DnaC
LARKRFLQPSIIFSAIEANLSLSEWARLFGDTEMTTAIVDRVNEHCRILEIGNASFRAKQSQAQKKLH